jgi:general secretion pathway protein G
MHDPSEESLAMNRTCLSPSLVNRRERPVRAGFTLVELLVVVVVIGILVALLVPAVMGGIRRARDAQTSAEIQTIAQSLQSFKTKYGDFPPSRIILMENGFYDTSNTTRLSAITSGTWFGTAPTMNGTDITYGELAARSVRYLRKFFPRANLSTTGAVFPAASTTWYDFNGDGAFQTGRPILLEGHECLVFFLGGIPNRNPDGTTSGMGGFSNNPANPFKNETAEPSPRQRPFFEFKAERFLDEDGDGIAGYTDPLATGSEARPYIYFSSYGTNSYDPNDANTASGEETGTGRDFSNGSVTKSSPSPNPYATSLPVPATGGAKFINPDTYQIISAGRDRNYGPGGRYDANSTAERLPVDGANIEAVNAGKDNLSNFSQGTLE